MNKTERAADALLAELLGRMQDRLTENEAAYLKVTVIDVLNKLACSAERFAEQFERLVDLIEIPIEANYPGAFVDEGAN